MPSNVFNTSAAKCTLRRWSQLSRQRLTNCSCKRSISSASVGNGYRLYNCRRRSKEVSSIGPCYAVWRLVKHPLYRTVGCTVIDAERTATVTGTSLQTTWPIECSNLALSVYLRSRRWADASRFLHTRSFSQYTYRTVRQCAGPP